jgi:hypothetical protein
VNSRWHTPASRHERGAARRSLAAALVALGVAGPAVGQTRPGAPVGDSVIPAEVMAADARRAAAEAARDTAALRRLLAPEFYWVAPDGELLGPAARLYRIARGLRATDSIVELGRPLVRRLADSLVLVTHASVVWGTRGGASTAGAPLRVTKLYARRGGEWLLLFQQGTPLAPEHAPAPRP